MSGIKYRIRNRLHEVVGTLTREQLLRRINGGKFGGDEEIAAPPYEKWHKLSSHPDFYDAFIRRLYSEKYQSPAVPELSQPEQREPSEENKKLPTSRLDAKATRVLPGEGESEDRGKTAQLPSGANDRGGTFQQSFLDNLFSEAHEKDAPLEEKVVDATLPLGTALMDLESPSIKTPLPSPLNLDAIPMESPEAQERAEGSSKREIVSTRRKVLYGGVLLFVLVSLFWRGGDKPLPPVAKQEDNLPVVRQLLASGVSKVDKAKSLLLEADAISENDAPVFYLNAREVILQAKSFNENNPVLLGKLALVNARLLPDYPKPQELIEEIERQIALGRATEPHLSAYYRAQSLVSLYQKKTEEARRAITFAIESDPSDAENALVLGEIQHVDGDIPSAQVSVTEAVRLSPTNVRARYTLAKIAFDQGDLARARLEVVEALKQNPLHGPSYLLMGDILRESNQVPDAKSLYETSAKLAHFQNADSAARAYFHLAEILRSEGQVGDANTRYQLAYYYSPKADSSLVEKVKGQNLNRGELGILARELEYGPLYFEEQAEGLLEQGKLPEAYRFLQAAHVLSPTDGLILIRMGETLEKTATSYEDFRRVTNLYERAIERDPKQARGYIRLGMLETEQYNLERAYKLLKQAEVLRPEDAETCLALGRHFYKRQDYNEALEQFLKAIKYNPNNSEVLYYAGLLRLAIKRDSARDAMPFFYQAYTIDNQNYDALVEWLKLKVLSFDKNQAIKFVKSLMQKEPKNSNLYWALGEVYAANKEYRKAITLFHQSLDLNNRSGKVRMSLAGALRSVGDLEKAVAEYRLASLLDRRNSDGFYNAADILFSTRNYNQAEEVLKYLVGVTPNYPGALRYLSKIYALRGQEVQAIEAMQKEVANNPENYKFVTELAELFMSYKKYQEAVNELNRVTGLSAEYTQDKIRGYLLLSRCYLKLDKAANAESAVKLALKLDDKDPELHKELGYVYYAQQRDKEGAKEFEYYLNRNPAARDADSLKNLMKHMVIED